MNLLLLAEQFRKAVQFFTTSLSDEQAIEVPTIYPEWINNFPYKTDNIVAYGINKVGDPQLYRCLQAHTSQEDWKPASASSLWKAIGIADDGVPVWAKPVGAVDAYNVGDKVHYPNKDGPIYESIIDGNVWSPDAYPQGWKLVE